MKEIIFEATEEDVDAGFSASALGLAIHTQAESIEELRGNIREAVFSYFDDDETPPRIIRLHSI